MPSTLTYPGVYIEEIPSGVRTITGVSTSVVAFIGRAQRGPVNEPITMHSLVSPEQLLGAEPVGRGFPMFSTLGRIFRQGILAVSISGSGCRLPRANRLNADGGQCLGPGRHLAALIRLRLTARKPWAKRRARRRTDR